VNKEFKGLHAEDRKILTGLIMFALFVIITVYAGSGYEAKQTNVKLRKQISYLQHEIEVLKTTIKTDIIDREGERPYNQVAGHLKSLGL
jgi:cell division protein FtsB